MNVVEAIDAWIDDRIDDLSDTELEEVLDLLDLIADSDFAGLDADSVDDDDIDDMVALVDGDDEQINYAHWVFSRVLIGEEDLGACYLDAEAGDLATAGIDGDGDETVFARFDTEIRGAVGAEGDTADEPDGPWKDRERAPDPIVLLPAADGLGPSFLPPVDIAPREPVRDDSWKRWMVASLIIAAMAVFAYGTVQLFGSLDETSVAATSTTATQDTDDDATSPLTSNAGDAVAAADRTASREPADAITPQGVTRAPAQAAIVLSNGSIVLATLSAPNGDDPTEYSSVYEPDPDENFGRALKVAWSDAELGVLDASGNVHIIDTAAGNRSTIYVPDDERAPAIAIAPAGPQVAILTADGNMWVINKTDTASTGTLTELWDAEEEQAQVTSITAVADQIAFSLDSGDAKLMSIATSPNTITDLWSGAGDGPAPRIESGPNDTLLWIWEGAISRYLLGATDEARVEVAWDPSTVDEERAIHFSPSGEKFAVILQDGGLVLATENGAATTLWDPVETELRAQAISASAHEIIMLLETGSVLRIAIDADPPHIDALWDITDETLSPARQVAIKP